jgi:hypothetical protein
MVTNSSVEYSCSARATCQFFSWTIQIVDSTTALVVLCQILGPSLQKARQHTPLGKGTAAAAAAHTAGTASMRAQAALPVETQPKVL